jgi:hypothetical protein
MNRRPSLTAHRKALRRITRLTLCACLACAVAPRLASAQAIDQKAPPAIGRVTVGLEASFLALQVADLQTTFRATDRGLGFEANPLMGDRGVAIAAKAAVGLSVVLMTEHWRKKHPVAAVVTMGLLNAVYVGIVAHNYRVGSREP